MSEQLRTIIIPASSIDKIEYQHANHVAQLGVAIVSISDPAPHKVKLDMSEAGWTDINRQIANEQRFISFKGRVV